LCKFGDMFSLQVACNDKPIWNIDGRLVTANYPQIDDVSGSHGAEDVDISHLGCNAVWV
jgi:hypothetical protein